jgi:hypothetical protein
MKMFCISVVRLPTKTAEKVKYWYHNAKDGSQQNSTAEE